MNRSAEFSIRATLIAAAFVMIFSSAYADSPPAPVTILKAARVYDGRGGPPITPASIRIEGEKIIQIGTSVETPASAKVIDLGDATLMPGLIDLHTHLTNQMGVHWED